MNKLVLLMLSFSVFAQNLDLLIAKTSMALGDEYLKLVTEAQIEIEQYVRLDPEIFAKDSSEQPNRFKEATLKYNQFKELAKVEYKDVFCQSDCRSPIPSGGLQLASSNNYLVREAYTKYSNLSLGSDRFGRINKYAPIYAVNSNFKEHILSRLSNLIDTQQRLDIESRKLNETLNSLQSSFVDLDTQEIVGVDEKILRESNYTLDKQTQINSYESCIESNTTQEKFEEQELSKSIAQLDVLQKNLKGNLSRVFDFTYENTAGNKVINVQANQGWQEFDSSFDANDKVYISTSGKWNVRGAVTVFENGDLYRNFSNRFFGLDFDDVMNIGTGGIWSATKSLLGEAVDEVDVDRRLLDNLTASNEPAFNKIREGLDCAGDGYSFSFSDSLSRGVSQGESNGASAGIALIGSFGKSEGRSGGTSEGRSISTGGTYQLKFNTTAMPSAPVGSLIASFCETNPATNSSCPVFFVGNNKVLEVGASDGSKEAQTLDHSGQIFIQSRLQGNLGNGKTITFVASTATGIYPQTSDFNLDVDGNLTINIRTSTKPYHFFIGFNSNAPQAVKDLYEISLGEGTSSNAAEQVNIGSGSSLLSGGYENRKRMASGLKLWLRANDNETFGNNTGEIAVEVRKQQSFLTFWDEYYEWFSSSCDENGANCGLGYILENIAYIPNPYVVAKATFVKQFPDFPVEVREIILQQINYLVEIAIAQRDILAKEMSAELTATKLNSCYDQMELTKKQLANTKDLVATFQAQEQNINTKRSLLRVTERFYERELSAINTVREKNLERLKRYYALAVNSYNYLYLDNLKVQDESNPYFEGDYYSEKIDQLEDLVFEITTINDLLNPNRSFIVYDLSPEELKNLTNPEFRKRETIVKLDYDQFYCKGFNIENQGRVMIEKVGVLLDINPAKEYLFFQNNNKRSTQLELTHGLENRFFDFTGKEHGFWMPSQTRNIKAYSSRILVDSNSDYLALRDTNYFDRLSFRKSSFATTWQLELKDPSLLMYENTDTSFENPLLEGVKLVFWINSSEVNTGSRLNECLEPASNLIVSNATQNSLNISWSFDVNSIDANLVSSFTVYRSSDVNKGFKAIESISKSSCSMVSNNYECNFTDLNLESGKEYFYQIRAGYNSPYNLNDVLNGIATSSTSGITLN